MYGSPTTSGLLRKRSSSRAFSTTSTSGCSGSSVQAQKAWLLGVSLAARPQEDLNHWRLLSTSETSAIGTRKMLATRRVIESNLSSGWVSKMLSDLSRDMRGASFAGSGAPCGGRTGREGRGAQPNWSIGREASARSTCLVLVGGRQGGDGLDVQVGGAWCHRLGLGRATRSRAALGRGGGRGRPRCRGLLMLRLGLFPVRPGDRVPRRIGRLDRYRVCRDQTTCMMR